MKNPIQTNRQFVVARYKDARYRLITTNNRYYYAIEANDCKGKLFKVGTGDTTTEAWRNAAKGIKRGICPGCGLPAINPYSNLLVCKEARIDRRKDLHRLNVDVAQLDPNDAGDIYQALCSIHTARRHKRGNWERQQRGYLTLKIRSLLKSRKIDFDTYRSFYWHFVIECSNN